MSRVIGFAHALHSRPMNTAACFSVLRLSSPAFPPGVSTSFHTPQAAFFCRPASSSAALRSGSCRACFIERRRSTPRLSTPRFIASTLHKLRGGPHASSNRNAPRGLFRGPASTRPALGSAILRARCIIERRSPQAAVSAGCFTETCRLDAVAVSSIEADPKVDFLLRARGRNRCPR